MTIVSINNHYQDKLGYQDYYLGKAWKELGHEVHYITSDWHFDYPDYNNTVKNIIGNKFVGSGLFSTDFGASVHRLKSYNKKFTGLIWLKGFKKKLTELKPDYIVSHNVFTWQSIRLIFLAKYLNCPIVFDDHTTINLVRKSLLSKIVFSIFRVLFSKKMYKVANKIVGISATCIDVLNNNFGLLGSKVQMIPLGADNTLFKPSDELRKLGREELQILDNQIVITYTGKMYHQKNVHLIIEALNDITVTQNHSIVIYLVGNIAESYNSTLQNAIQASKHRLIIKKSLPVTDLVKVYNVTDVAVWPDHLTNSTIDASACGCAIICSHYMSERIAYNNGVTIQAGNLQELKKALQKLISNKELRNIMGQNGIKYVNQELSWINIAKKFISN